MKDTQLSYSELLYLHAEKYVAEASFLQHKEELPDGKKVNIVKLGNLASEAAFAYLYFNGHIDLELKTEKTLGIFSKQVLVANKKSDGANLTSLEKTIFDLSDGAGIANILYRAVGEECSVPWAVITGIVKESLVKKEFLTKEAITKKVIVSYVTYQYHLNPARKIDFNSEVAAMDDRLKEFAQKDFYKLLAKAVDSGISAQKEKPSDSD